MSNPTQNKKNAIAFYDLMFNQCKPKKQSKSMLGKHIYNTIPTLERHLLEWGCRGRAA
jgi:hypothetical protein